MTAVASLPQTPLYEHSYEVDEPDVSALVTEDDTPVDNIFTEKQERLLTEPLYGSWSGPPPEDGEQPRPFAALADVGLFWSPDEPPIVPDVMLSLDVKLHEDLSQKQNRSYFIWRFGKPPDVVIQIVSNRVGGELGDKLRRYRRLRIPYYVVFDPLHSLGGAVLRTFELRGELYVATDRARFVNMGLGLVEWDGAFEGMRERWLRWCTLDGELLPTGAERAATEKARAETEMARAETEMARAKIEMARAKIEMARAETEMARAEVAEARAETEKARAETEMARAEVAEARAARLLAKLRDLGIDPSGDA